MFDKEPGLDEWEPSSSEAIREGDRYGYDENPGYFNAPIYFHEPEDSGPITHSRKLARYLSQVSYLISFCTHYDVQVHLAAY